MDEKVLEYLNEKHKDAAIDEVSVEKRYSPTYGWEYWVYFMKNGSLNKEILSQHMYSSL